MKPSIDVDASSFNEAMIRARLGADDLLNMAGAGAAVVNSHQKIHVAHDTYATRDSIRSHIQTSTRTRVVDDIGPETEYAPYIEYGVASKPNYPIQPFVVPSATGNNYRDCVNAIATALFTWIGEKWPK
jgi:hypothetical protein